MPCLGVIPLVPPGADALQRRADTALSNLLVDTWSLHTGRALPRDVPVEDLSSQTLIGFWADPAMSDGLT
ncbi:hypothetical protein GCM10023191_101830 [Actinoallomurus oryzae]|uniref:Uncharacterized protein n=1 Tax=Actinoallomurus oryzae TaxID=502180 RepID=A0ABP8R9Z2_9ACTN